MLTETQRSLIRHVLENQETFTFTIATILLDNYETQWLDWEIETIERELFEDFGARLQKQNRDKVLTAQILMTTDQFYTDWLVFNYACEVLNNDPVFLDIFDPATPDQLCWAVIEAALFESKESAPEFSDEVKSFVGVNLSYHGIHTPPKVLTFATMPDSSTRTSELEPDPIMIEALQRRQIDNHDKLADYVNTRMGELLAELERVPLQHRDDSSWKPMYDKLSGALATL